MTSTFPISVFSLVYVVLAADYPSSIIVMALFCEVSHVLDRDTGIVAQPGVPSGIFGGIYFLPPVDLQHYLRRRTQLGTRGDCKQLPSLEDENGIGPITYDPIMMVATIRSIFMLTRLTP